jgi:iron complex transport system permease protein
MPSYKNLLILSVLFSLLVLACSILLAPSALPWQALIDPEHPWRQIVIEIRLPRALGGFCIGALLAASGVLIQGLFRNPLAEPGVIGISSGAALGAALAIFTQSAMWLLPIAACVGAFVAVMVLLSIGRNLIGHQLSQFILVGVALNFTATATLGLLTYLSDERIMRSISFWSFGNLSAIHFSELAILSIGLIVLCLLIPRYLTQLNIWLMGEHHAKQLGINTQRLTIHLVLLISAMVGLAVAFCGVISFIGLLVPHSVRAIVGMDTRKVLPLSMLLGGSLVLLADWLAQALLAPAQLPLSLILAIGGGPLFILLLNKVQKRGWA